MAILIAPIERLMSFGIIITLILLLWYQKWRWMIYFVLIVTLMFIMTRVTYFALMASFYIYYLPSFVFGFLLVKQYQVSQILAVFRYFRLPASIQLSIMVCVRFIPLFQREYRLCKVARYNRQLNYRWYQLGRWYSYTVIPQLFRCLALSRELSLAALAKGFQAKQKRTNYFAQSFTIVDVLFLIICLCYIYLI